jgi:hypothetical protein
LWVEEAEHSVMPEECQAHSSCDQIKIIHPVKQSFGNMLKLGKPSCFREISRKNNFVFDAQVAEPGSGDIVTADEVSPANNSNQRIALVAGLENFCDRLLILALHRQVHRHAKSRHRCNSIGVGGKVCLIDLSNERVQAITFFALLLLSIETSLRITAHGSNFDAAFRLQSFYKSVIAPELFQRR